MKKLIQINIILIIIIQLIPINKQTKPKQVEMKQSKVVAEVKQIEQEQTTQTELKQINLILDTNSDLRITSNLSAEQFNKILTNTGLEGLGKSFEEAEKKHNINGLYLIGLACLESNYREK